MATANRDLDSLTGVVVPSTTGTVQGIMYVGGNEDTDTTAYDAVWPLVPGDNLVKFMVTSPDGSRTKIYKIHVNKDPSTDATLESLSLVDSTTSTPVAVTLSPAFNPATTAYTATVGPAVTSVTLTGIQNHDGATISNDQGPDVTSGEATVGPWAGESVINIDLTAEDGATTKRYTVTAERILTVNFDAAAYSVDEGNLVQVSVSLDGVPGNEVRTNLSTTLQGATTADFGGVPEYVTFAGTDAVMTFDFVARTDIPSDPGESVTIGLSPNSQFPGLQTGSTDETVVSIGDIVTDQLVAVDFGQSTYSVNEGASVPITITLATAPSSLVTIPLTITAEGDATSPDYSVPNSVTFDSGDTSQTITFSATLDADTDPGESVKIELGTLPMGYAAGATTETTVSINNFSVVVNFGAASYDVAEDGEVQISVTLSPALGSDVAIGLMAAGQDGATTADYSLPTSVTFTAGQTQQTFTFTSKMDDVDDDDERVIIGFDALPAGVYVGTTAPTTVVNIADNDHPQISLGFEKGTYTVIEGQSIGLKLKLSGEPERGITITVRANLVVDNPASGNDFSGIPSDVHFAADATEAILTFAATDDSIDEDDEYVKLEPDLRLPAGVGLGDNFFTIVTIIDPPQVSVSFEQATYTVSEGSSETIKVKLDKDPERTVTIPINKANQGGATNSDYSSPADVTFNSGDTEKTFSFAAATDSDNDDGESVKLTFGTLPTGVTAGITTETVVSITAAGVSISESSLTIAEGNTDTYTVALNSQPMGDVTVTIAGAGTDLSLDNTTLTFTTTTWASAQTVTVTAVDDEIDDDGETVTLTHTVASADDSDYQGISARSVAVSITDNDGTGVTVSRTALTVTEEDTTGDTYTVVLNTQPTASVTVTVAGHAGSDVTPTPATLTFTPMNWDTAQTVTVTAANDADTANDTVTLTHSATSTDSDYDGVTVAGVTVTVNDNDTAPPPPPPQRTGGGGGGTPSNRSPSFTEGAQTSRSVVENTAAGQDIGAPLEAVDPDRQDTLTYSLEGEDAASFDIDAATGQLRTKAALDYETRASYALTVRVADRRGSWDAMEVTVNVTNVGLAGMAGQYDRDDSGAIDRDEAIAAVVDYFNSVISKEEAIEVVRVYFVG